MLTSPRPAKSVSFQPLRDLPLNRGFQPVPGKVDVGRAAASAKSRSARGFLVGAGAGVLVFVAGWGTAGVEVLVAAGAGFGLVAGADWCAQPKPNIISRTEGKMRNALFILCLVACHRGKLKANESKFNRNSPLAPSYLRAVEGGVLVSLKVQPRASASEICGVAGNELRVRITAPPVDSAANQALLEFLAERLGCRKNALVLVKGHTSRHKIVRVEGMTVEAVERNFKLPSFVRSTMEGRQTPNFRENPSSNTPT